MVITYYIIIRGDEIDTPETYIKMCDCEEIQEDHKWEYGDYLIWKWDANDTSNDTIVIGDAGFDYDMSNIHIPPIRSKMPMLYTSSNSTPLPSEEITWIPLQHQLQEMAKNSYDFACDDFELVELFYNFVWLDNPQWDKLGITSMNQLWLVFVMKEKYNKVWNGEKWEVTR